MSGPFYVHLTCDLNIEGNRPSKFKCELAQELILPQSAAWFVSLAQFTCTKPARNGRINDDAVVCLKEAETAVNPRGIISQHCTVGMSDDYSNASADCTSVHTYQPKTSRSSPRTHLLGNTFTAFHVTLSQHNGAPFFMTEDSARSSLELCIEKMDVRATEDIVLHIGSEKSDSYPDNTASEFSFNLPPHLSHTDHLEWYLAINSLAHPTRFRMFPSDWDLDEELNITLRMQVRSDYTPNTIDGTLISRGDGDWVRSCPITLGELASCRNLSEMVKTLNSSLGKCGSANGSRHSELLEFKYDKKHPKKIEVVWKTGMDAVREDFPFLQLELPTALACILGLLSAEKLAKVSSYKIAHIHYLKMDESMIYDSNGQRHNSPLSIALQPEPNAFVPAEMYLHCYDVQTRHVGGRMQKTVAIVPIERGRCFDRARMRSSTRYEPVHLQFHRLQSKHLESLRFELTDGAGSAIIFPEDSEAGIHVIATLRLIW